MPTRDQAWPEGTPNWVDLSVDDAHAAAAFYERLFGWTTVDTGDEGGGYLLTFKDGHPAAGIGPKQDPQQPSNWSTYFAAADADAAASKVTAAGGQTLFDPMDVGPQGRMFFAAAPDGATFGVWQAGEHHGAGIYNEHGALAWNELHSNDLDSARAFYGSVFGFDYEDLTNPEFTYFVFKRSGEQDAVGGMGTNEMAPPGTPSHWMTWFAADNCDDVAARVVELGGSSMMEPATTPFGRMAIVTGAQGEMFGLIDLATTS